MEKRIFSLTISKKAKRDIIEIHNYISIDSHKYTLKIVQEFLKAFEIIKKFPKIGKKYPMKFKNHSKMYEFHYRSYRIIYSIKENNIYILTIIHQAQNIK